MLKTSQITVEILLICYAALSLGALLPRSPAPVLHEIIFGHPVSEAAHDFSGPGTVLGSTNTLPLRYPQNLSYRQIGADANHTQQQTLTGNQSTFITVTVRVHLSLPTYITLKMYYPLPGT
jgi:hypothetical protein